MMNQMTSLSLFRMSFYTHDVSDMQRQYNKICNFIPLIGYFRALIIPQLAVLLGSEVVTSQPTILHVIKGNFSMKLEYGKQLLMRLLCSAIITVFKICSFVLFFPTIWTRRAAPSAEFSVDRTRHLMSFLTMLGPSPDWNVGLSGEDLCTKDCGWVQRLVTDLIPWDAGTDSGVTYEVSYYSFKRFLTPVDV